MTQIGWVIGAAGFLGNAMSKALINRGWLVGGIGRGLSQTSEGVWLDGDVSPELLAKLEGETGLPDFVFHAAGSGSVRATSAQPDQSRLDTVGSASLVLGFLSDLHADIRFVYPSSCAVYGRAAIIPTPESVRREPVSLYGSHKAEVEDLCDRACRNGNLRASVLRYFSVYGPGLRKQLLWDVAMKLRSSVPMIQLDGDGSEVRDFFYVDDAIELAIKAAATEREGLLVVNGGTGRGTTISQVAQRIIDNLAPDTELHFTGTKRRGDPNIYTADTIQATNELGFESAWDWEQGIDAFCEWFASLNELEDPLLTRNPLRNR